jgi:hypothetical protein
MLVIAGIHQSESGWTVLSFRPSLVGDVLHIPEKVFVRTELLVGIDVKVGMSVQL